MRQEKVIDNEARIPFRKLYTLSAKLIVERSAQSLISNPRLLPPVPASMFRSLGVINLVNYL